MMSDTFLLTLKCPVCHTYFNKPIIQCVAGHSICSECKSTRKECPLCQKPYAEIRNYALENILDKVSIKCKYATCPTLCSINDYDQHVDECMHELRPCFYCCELVERRLLYVHVKTAHREICVENGSKLCDTRLLYCTILYDAKVFWVKRSCQKGVYYWTVQNYHNQAEDVIYHARIQLSHGQKVFTFDQPCLKWSDISLNQSANNGLVIGVSQAKFDCYTVTVTISKSQ